MTKQNVWNTYSNLRQQELEAVNEKYKSCLDSGKTERECVRHTVTLLQKEGYRPLEEWTASEIGRAHV